MIKIFQIDAFTSKYFLGNPAAVCPLENWLDDRILQEIAEENNLSETAFFVPDINSKKNNFAIRWFTPAAEVNLCGHATIAAAYVIYHELNWQNSIINFSSHSGQLTTKKIDENIEIIFPKAQLKKLPHNHDLAAALGANYRELYFAGEDYLTIFNNENEVKNLTPNFNLLKDFQVRGIVASSLGEDVDFVSRAFFPRLNVNEDPVCGSAHTYLTPYWQQILGKNSLHAKQISKRGGEIFCSSEGDKIILSGKCKLYLRGEIFI